MTDDPVFIPTEDDRDPHAEAEMQLGKSESLADPWFDTEEGQRWLAETRDAAGDPGIGGF